MTLDEYFAETPFPNTASPETAIYWAGRPEVLKSLQRMVRGFSRLPDSSLNLLWANLGAGKTHVLYHLKHMLEGSEESKVACVYIELPEQVRGFLDLYIQIAKNLPLTDITIALSGCPPDLLPLPLVRAVRILQFGGAAEIDVVTSWLQGGGPHLRDLKACGIQQRIESDVIAVEILSGLIVALAHSKVRFVLMIDEYQRIGVLAPAKRDRVLSSLRSVFSHSPKFFSVIISVMSQAQDTAEGFISEELKTLLGPGSKIALPEMNTDEALEFVEGRLGFFRPDGYSGSKTAPFGEAAVAEVLRYLKEDAQKPLIPRIILQALFHLYQNAEYEGGEMGLEEVTSLLAEV